MDVGDALFLTAVSRRVPPDDAVGDIPVGNAGYEAVAKALRQMTVDLSYMAVSVVASDLNVWCQMVWGLDGDDVQVDAETQEVVRALSDRMARIGGRVMDWVNAGENAASLESLWVLLNKCCDAAAIVHSLVHFGERRGLSLSDDVPPLARSMIDKMQDSMWTAGRCLWGLMQPVRDLMAGPSN